MPINEYEWRDTFERSQLNPLVTDMGYSSQISRFLRSHAPLAFTVAEITDNLDFTAVDTAPDRLRDRVAGAIKGAAKKRVVKYFLNQLVAEGHVETRIKSRLDSERIYYRWRQF